MNQRVTRGTLAYTPLKHSMNQHQKYEKLLQSVERLSGHFGFPMSLDSNVMDFMRDLKPMRAYTYVLPPIAC